VSDRYAARIARLLGVAAGRCGTDERLWRHFLNGLPEPVRRGLLQEWHWQAHGGQAVPAGAWTVWLLMAGRGFGKTRAGWTRRGASGGLAGLWCAGLAAMGG
jgi:hypothetical protein